MQWLGVFASAAQCLMFICSSPSPGSVFVGSTLCVHRDHEVRRVRDSRGGLFHYLLLCLDPYFAFALHKEPATKP